MWGLPTVTLGAYSGVASSGPTELIALRATNRSTFVIYLMVFDDPVIPVAGSSPFYQWPVPASSWLSEDIVGPWRFSRGLSWCFSATAGTYTPATRASDHDILISCT